MVKKKDQVTVTIESLSFPKKGKGMVEGMPLTVKGVLPGQTVRCAITKKREGRLEGRLLEILERAPYERAPLCSQFDLCGGCTYQTISMEQENAFKEQQVLELLKQAGVTGFQYEGITASQVQKGYRNKCEFSFGDNGAEGRLSLGMRRRNSFYEVVTLEKDCTLVDDDFVDIIHANLDFFASRQIPFYHKGRHDGVLRHLVVRKGHYTGEILLNLVTASQWGFSLEEWKEKMLSLPLQGKIVSLFHTVNDSVADVVKSDESTLLYGQEYFTDRLFDLSFRITPFSFFQTNTRGAEQLYQMVKDYVGEGNHTVLFDLYCGTGTISQVMARQCKKVYGIELVAEAVEAAKENAAQNGIDNCTFLAGDVLELVDQLEEKPDVIIVDPPRDGIHPKAIGKIIAFGAPKIVYVSCKPSSLARDLAVFQENGYVVKRLQLMNQFGHTEHIETVVELVRAEER